MFYGLSRFIKNLLPKRLFYRALLIVAAPIIILQIIISIHYLNWWMILTSISFEVKDIKFITLFKSTW